MPMYPARGRTALILAAFLACLAGPPLAALPPSAGAKGRFTTRYAVSLEGFGSALFGEGEYAGLSLAAGWEDKGGFGAGFSARLLTPINPPVIAGSLAGLGAELTLGRFQRHFLAWMSPRRTALAPAIGVAAYVPLGSAFSPRYVLEAAPLRLYSGYGYVSLCSPRIVLDGSLAPAGWGLKLFEFSYLLQ
jgi:hypothetical protein